MTSVPKSVRRLPIGAEVQPGGFVYFRVWAPKRQAVHVVIRDPAGKRELRRLKLDAEEGGYFSTIGEAPAGEMYAFLVDNDDRPLPDPASRFQPDGPEGFSRVVDSASFAWTDGDWPGLKPEGQVFYEMHIGTFTPEGTWQAAARELPELARLGITTLEIMPLADFPGEFGWGYDGVNLFAPTRLYGQPDDFRRFVDAAHAQGLGVILDVVYNHFGNFGNMLGEFSDDYFTDNYPNEWGKAINFDGRDSLHVREFFLANVRYWIEEFHLDGYRLDATQAIHDASPEHILTAIARVAREAAGRRGVLLVAENEPQETQQVRSPSEGGYGLDMAWNDDFHHAAIVRLTGHNEAYYSDYLGAAEEFLAAVKHGFLYQGQHSQWQEKPRGTRTDGLPAWSFVNFLENHDQVANSATGRRLHAMASPACYRAMTTLWLVLPADAALLPGSGVCFFARFPLLCRRAGRTSPRGR